MFVVSRLGVHAHMLHSVNHHLSLHAGGAVQGAGGGEVQVRLGHFVQAPSNDAVVLAYLPVRHRVVWSSSP